MRRYLFFLILCLASFAGNVYAQTDDYAALHQGNRAFQRGEWSKAEQYYREALKANPRNARALFNLGDAYLAQKNGKDALDCFVKAAKTETNKSVKAMAYHNIGFIHHNNKDYDKAIDAYKEALRNNPRDEDTRYNLALAQKQKKDHQQQDQNKDNKNDSNSGQNQQNDQNQEQQQQQQQPQMSDDNIEQLLNMAKQAEQQTRQKLDKAQQPRKKSLNKAW